MNFLYPQFLWALLALAVPVIVHLFNFKRYKTVLFSNNRFLQAVQKRSRSFNRLKHFLILCSRILALIFLVLAFAQPYIPAAQNEGSESRYAALYVDNSLSMTSQGLSATLLDEARSQAIDILKSLPGNYRVQVITNDFEGRQQNYYSVNEAIQLVDEIQPSYAFRSSGEIYQRVVGPWQSINSDNKGKLQLFMLSDFQRSQFPDFEEANDDWSFHYLPAERANLSGNIAIDSVSFDRPVLQPGFDQEVNIDIRNYGTEPAENISVKLELNGQTRGAREITLAASASERLSFTIRPEERGSYAGKVVIEGGEPYFDNEFFFSFRIDAPLRILAIGSSAENIFQRLYADEIYQLEVLDLNDLNYGELQSYNTIILNELSSFPTGLGAALKQHLQNGGNVVLIPSPENSNTNDVIAQSIGIPLPGNIEDNPLKASEVEYSDLLFEQVFNERPDNPHLPAVKRYFPLEKSGGFPVITLENQDPLIMRYPRENGQVIVLAVNLDSEVSSLPRHPIFVPVMLNAALYSTPRTSLYNSAGRSSGQQFDDMGDNDTPLRLILEGQEIIPLQRSRGNKTEIYNLPPEVKPGIYSVTKETEEIGKLAVNVDPRESQWEFWNTENLEEATSGQTANIIEAGSRGPGAEISSLYKGYPLWRWFLSIALLFLLLEILLLKYWK